MKIHRITNEDQARAIATALMTEERTRPTAVVTTPAQRATPHIDVEAMAQDLEGLVDVHLIETGPHTWTFSERMAPLTQVYGGAGRVYPVGRSWIDDPHRSPLRFAYDAAEGKRATELLIDDGLSMAAAAGLLGGTRRHRDVQRVEGVVRRIISERAIVETDQGMVSVPPQLAVPGLPVDRVLQDGMVVHGTLQTDSRWLDVREMARSADEALEEYAVGDVVLAQVGRIKPGTAQIHLHPEFPVTVDRRDVTGELAGDLRDLLTEDEVLAVRIVATAPDWHVTLYDAEGPLQPAIALFPGGPPWLDECLMATAGPEVATDPECSPDVLPPVVEPVETRPPEPPPPPTPPESRPSPMLLDPKRRGQQPSPPAPTRPPEPTVAGRTQPRDSEAVEALKGIIRELRSEVRGLEEERQQLLDFRRDNEARLEAQRRQLAELRKQLRKARSRSTRPASPEFADREQGFRHAVEAAWAGRTPVPEQLTRPLPDYAIGPRFLDSLEAMEGVSRGKVADVVFEIVTGRAESLAGRDLHQLRTGDGGDDPQQTRADGAGCWRVALQQNSPSARRLHFWRLLDGSVELSRVVLHDDMEP